MNESTLIRLHIPDENEIRYTCTSDVAPEISTYIWIECPFNKNNYKAVSKLFKKVYCQDIKFFPEH